MRTLYLLLLATLGLSNSLSAQASCHPVGTISVVIGQAYAQTEHSPAQKLKQGDTIAANTTLTTEQGSRLIINLCDQGALSLRPNTKLTIQTYQYHPDQPQQNHIDLKLEYGSVRSITGQAAKANKERFRLNTPVVAVGVRGTDFLVQTDQNISRAALYSGAITVVPQSQGCAQTNLSACAGALNLEEQSKHLIIQYQQGMESPIHVQPPQEWMQQQDESTEHPNGSTITKTIAPMLEKRYTEELYINANAPAKKYESLLIWIPATQIGQAQTKGTPIIASPLGVLYSLANTPNMPTQGQFTLNLNQSHLVMPANPGQAIYATAGQLNLDINQRRFNTQLQFQAPQLITDGMLNATGIIRQDGRFYSDAGQPGVSGVIINQAKEAAYLFKHHEQGHYIEGVTTWK